MQFPSFFKKKAQQPEEAASRRIEPQIGGEDRAASAADAEASSWDEKTAAEAPAFEVVSDERTARSAEHQEPTLKAPAAPQVSAEQPASPAAAPELPVLNEPGAAPQPAAPKPSESESAPAQSAEPKSGRRSLSEIFRSAAHREQESAQPPSEEEIAMRQKTRYRLAGAAAILIAVIVVAPFVLDRENAADEAQVSTAIPPVPDKASTTLAPPVPEKKAESAAQSEADAKAAAEEARRAEEAKAAEQARAAEEAKAAAAAKAEQARAEQAARQKAAEQAKAKQQEAARKEAAKKQEARKEAAAAPSGRGWYVQVMATRSERTASQLVAKLKGQGFPAYSVSGKDRIIRVRVGLYKDKAAAQGAQGTLALNGYTGKLIVGAQ